MKAASIHIQMVPHFLLGVPRETWLGTGARDWKEGGPHANSD